MTHRAIPGSGLLRAVAAIAFSALILLSCAVSAAAAPTEEDPSTAQEQSTGAGDSTSGDSAPSAEEAPQDGAPAAGGQGESDQTPVVAIEPAAESVKSELPPDLPQLSIAVDNGRASAAVGDKLDYTITVQNLGAADIADLVVTQTQPEGLDFVSADSEGQAEAGLVTWKLNLAKSQTTTFHTSLTVKTTAPDLLRLATVACASTSADGPPIVCAAHSDQLPAGAAAEANQAAMASAEAVPQNRVWWWFAAAGIAFVIVAATAVIVALRRRSSRARAAEPTDQKTDGFANSGVR